MIKTYTELSRFNTYEDRYLYLKLAGQVGDSTFGWDRYLNQILYSSYRWKKTRRNVIIRDNGCDMGLEGYEIPDKIIIHHMNPITVQDIENDESWIYNPEYLICVSDFTHNAIHFGIDKNLFPKVVERHSGDTKLW